MNGLYSPTRRKIIGGIGLLFAAPAIVKAESIMPIKALAPDAASEYIWRVYKIGIVATPKPIAYDPFERWRRLQMAALRVSRETVTRTLPETA